MKKYAPTKSFKLTVFFFYAGFRWMLCGMFPFGVIAEVIFLIRFLTGGGLHQVLEAPYEDSREYKECVMGIGYNFKEELEMKKRHMADCYDQQRDAWKRIPIGFVLLLIGIGLTLFSQAMIAAYPWFTGGFFTVMLEYYALILMLTGYLDADFPLPKAFRNAFSIKTIPVKLEHYEKMIAPLEKRVEMEREKEREKEKERDTEVEKGDGAHQESKNGWNDVNFF